MFAKAGNAGRSGIGATLNPLESQRAEQLGFAVDETHWGYVIRSTARTSFLVEIVQGVAFVFGICLLVATLGLWLLPDSLLSGPVLGMKFAASTIASLAGWFFIWFSSRGTRSEVHIDTRLAEVREVVTNRIGRPTLLNRHGFDVVSDVDIDQVGEAVSARRPASLVIRGDEDSALVRVATGSREALDRLRQRLGRDLMVADPSGHEAPYDVRGVMLRPA